MDLSDILNDETTSTTVVVEPSLEITPCHTFGVIKRVKNHLLFPDEETVIFPSGKHCVRYHVLEGWTKFIYCAKASKRIQVLALSPDQRYLAVSESGKSCTITIIDLEDKMCCKRQVLKGSDYGVQKFVCMAFSADSKYLLSQREGPTWTLFYWQWETKELIATVNTTKSGSISQVSFNPKDDTEICVTGRGVFKTFKLKKGFLNEANSYKKENNDVLCHAWMSVDCIIAGTKMGRLLMVKSRKLHMLERPLVRQTGKSDSSSLDQLASVTSITSYSKGFACSAGPGLVCLYEKTKDKTPYRKTAEIRIPVDPSSNQQIATMCFSPMEETLAISTDRGQLYHINLTLTNFKKSKKAQFKFLSHSLHSDSITGLSTCASQPLVATCSKDHTIHIWNYETKSLELFKEFDEEPLSVSMHPNGHYILVGFSTEVCLMKIINGKIYTVQTFATSNCTECVFNHDGNRFAAVSRNVIYLYNIRTKEKLQLDGCRNKVQSVKWTIDDRRLVSCGMGDAIYLWNTVTGIYESKAMSEHIYTDMTLLSNDGSVIAVSHNSLQEIFDQRILREMTSDGVAYTAVSMTHSGQTVFIGTAAGTVRVIKYPDEEEKTLKEHQAHSGPITKMAVSPCDRFLLTASTDGCLLIWAITDQEGRTLGVKKFTDYLEEVLCTKLYMEGKNQTIKDLEIENRWLKEEQEHRLDMKDMDCNANMHEMMQKFLQEIEALNDQIQVLNTEKEDQKVSHLKALTEMMDKHAKELKDQELSHVESMTGAYEKNHELVQEMQMMQQNYEKKLNEAENSHLCAMEDTKQAYEAMLQELQDKLEQEVKNSEEKLKEIEDNAEYELMERCCNYEDNLQEEKEAKLLAQYELKLMEKNIAQDLKLKCKIKNQGLNISKLEEDVQNLKDQLKDAERTSEDLVNEIKEQSKTIDDKERYIEELQETINNMDMTSKEKEQELTNITQESKRAEEESQLKRNKMEQLEKEVYENKEMFRLVGLEMAFTKENYEKTIADLKQKLKLMKQAFLIERKKVLNVNTLLQRMKSDIQMCSRFIQEPKKLKETFVNLHTRYIHEPDVTIGVNAKAIQEHERQIEHFQRLFATERTNWAKEMKIETQRCIKLVKENTTLIQLLNEQKLMHQDLLFRLKEMGIQCVKTPTSFMISLPKTKHMFQLQHPVTQSVNRNLPDKRQGQISTLQSSPDHVILPPITPSRRPDDHKGGV